MNAKENILIQAALDVLNGTAAAAVSLITGLSIEEIDDLGGLPNEGVDSEDV